MTSATHHNIAAEFERALDAFDPDGSLMATDTGHLARTAAAAVIGWADAWNNHLGPFYTASHVRSLLSVDGRPISRQAVAQRANLVGLTTGSGRVVYPAFQFRTGSVPDNLGDILGILSEQIVSRWTVASWLVTPNAELNSDTPLDLLEAGTPQPAIEAAHRWALALGA